jgi:hypothetical protein
MKKLLISVTLLCLTGAALARVHNKAAGTKQCEFSLSNDSKYSQIYVSTNRNLATVVNKRTLREAENVAEVSNVKTAKSAKIVSNSFYIYTPTTVDGQYVQNFCVSANMADQESKKFRFKFTQIAQNKVEDPRISIENMTGKTGLEPKPTPARANKMTTTHKGPQTSATSMPPETAEERRRNNKVRDNQGYVEKDRPSQPDYAIYIDKKYPLGIIP